VFYKGDFTFDDTTIIIANKFYNVIKEKLHLENPELWVGVQKNSKINPWPTVKQLK